MKPLLLDFSLLKLLSRCLVRLDSGRLIRSKNMRCAIVKALEYLASFEKRISLQLVQKRVIRSSYGGATLPLPPHKRHGLLQLPSSEEAEDWVFVVESLWSVCITHGIDGLVWDKLSCRLLLWRAASSSSETKVGEWARQQAILALRGTCS